MGEDNPLASCCGSLVAFALNIACVCVGNNYWDQCDNGAAGYLYYSGIFGLVWVQINCLFLFGVHCCQMCSEDGKTKAVMKFFAGIGELIRIIWGFAVILPANAVWTYSGSSLATTTIATVEPEGSGYSWNSTGDFAPIADALMRGDPGTYCHYTPFMFAFVLVVMEAVILSLGAACCCCICFAAMVSG